MEERNSMIAELEKVKSIWPQVKDILSVPHTKKEYQKLVSALDELIDEIQEDQKHPLVPLMETIGNLVDAYENENFEPVESDPISVLRALMLEHNLSQKDLPEIGSQGVVSEILIGKRELNTRQIRALSNRFCISASVFI